MSDTGALRRAIRESPLRRTWVCTVGAGLVPARLSDTGALRRAIRESPLRGTGVCIVGAGLVPARLSGTGAGRTNGLRRGRRPRRPVCRTRARVGGRFGYRPYGGRGDGLSRAPAPTGGDGLPRRREACPHASGALERRSDQGIAPYGSP